MSLKCHNGSKLINKNQLFTIHSGEKNIDKPHFLLVESQLLFLKNHVTSQPRLKRPKSKFQSQNHHQLNLFYLFKGKSKFDFYSCCQVVAEKRMAALSRAKVIKKTR
jgi:hypothetical protein